jgi:hypothetical protein
MLHPRRLLDRQLPGVWLVSAEPTRLTRIRRWIADRLVDAGFKLCDLGSRVDPGPQGEPCPDCGVPVDVAPDEECPECRDRAEQQTRDDAIFDAGRERGYTEGQRDMEERYSGGF